MLLPVSKGVRRKEVDRPERGLSHALSLRVLKSPRKGQPVPRIEDVVGGSSCMTSDVS